MPTAKPEARDTDYAALRAASEAHNRLRALGWSDGRYCPKDGSLFEVCQPGPSVGVFKCSYSGEWPKGSMMVQDGNDIYPQGPDGLLWRSLKKRTS